MISRRALLASVVALVGAGAATMPGCAGSGRGFTVRPGDRSARLDALPGSLVVLPLGEAWPASLGCDAEGRVPATLDSGERVEARAYRLVAEPARAPTPRSWLPPAVAWTPVPISARTDGLLTDGPGTTRVLAIQMPPRPLGTVLTIGRQRLAVNWLAAPGSMVALSRDLAARAGRSPDAGDPWTPTMTRQAGTSPFFLALAQAEGASPLGRWRYRLLVDGLGPQASMPGEARTFAEPVVEALARQNEDRWRVALERLWLDDADLAQRVRSQLTRIVDFGGGDVAPAWGNDDDDLDRFLFDLLEPHLDPLLRTRRAKRWLDDQLAGVAWVVDDAGLEDAESREPVATLGLANLRSDPTLAWVDLPAGSPELVPLPGSSATTLRGLPGTASAGVNAGRWRRELPLASEKRRLVPPGLPLGPLVPDFTMRSWLGDVPASAPREAWLTGAILRGAPSGRTSTKDLELYVECRVPPGEGVTPGDCVRIFLGPSNRPTSVLRVGGDGVVSEEALRTDLVPTPAPVEVRVEPDRWTFLIRLPEGIVGEDGVVRLGLTRTDALGRRQAWPRPMLPWQQNPGRCAVDISAWSGR